MLTNLLHYEFKSTGRVVLPIAAGVLVLNIFTNILSHFVQNTSDRLPLAGVAMALLALASAVSLLVVLAICFFIEIQQFYRLLGERGYLMLALPVPIWQHIAAKVICGTVWTLFGMVFFTLCGMLTTDTVSGSGFALDFSRVTAEDVAIWSAMLLIILPLSRAHCCTHIWPVPLPRSLPSSGCSSASPPTLSSALSGRWQPL